MKSRPQYSARRASDLRLRNALLASAAVCAATVGAPQFASAQSAADPSKPAAVDPNQTTLSEVVVTAQKRTESAQTVPIAISVVSAAALQAAGLTDTSTLASAVPGLVYNRQSAVAEPFLRGIGSNISSAGSEPAVATYVDGVYYAAPEGNIFSLNNISRVEVLKGPQGTLFGRNSIGGVISVTTKDPSFTPHLDLMAGYGNYDTVETSAYGTTGITDKLAADLAVHYQDQASGWGTNFTTHKPAFADQHDIELRSKWVWTPATDTKVTFIADYLKYRIQAGPEYSVIPSEDDSIGQPGPGLYNLNADTNSSVNVEQKGVSVRIDQNIGWARLASITAYRRTNTHDIDEVDGSAAPLLELNQHLQNKQITQEFQILSPTESKFKWVAGFFYFHDEVAQTPISIFGLDFASPFAYGALPAPTGTTFVGNTQNSTQTTTSYSGFVDATVAILPDTNLTAGVRYTADTQALNVTQYLLDAPVASPLVGPFNPAPSPVALGPAPYCVAGSPCHEQNSKTFDKMTYRTVLDHRFNRNIMAYASYSVGFQSGIYNTFVQSFPTFPIDPEIVRGAEIGLKSELFNHKLRLNVSAFDDQIAKLQIFAVLSGVAVASNAAAARTKGVDADFEFVPVNHLTLRGGVEYLDARYTAFPGAQYYTYVAPADRLIPPHQGTVLDTFTADAAGNHLTQAPTFVAAFSGSYNIPTHYGDYTIDVSVNYNDGFYWDPQNRYSQPSYVLMNSSLTWSAPSGRWDVQLWGRNLLDEKIVTFGLPQAIGDIQSPAAPRTYGVRFLAHL